MSTYDSDTPEASRVIVIKSLQKALADERASKGDVLLRLSAVQDQLVEAEQQVQHWVQEYVNLFSFVSKLRLQYQRARAAAWANGIVVACLALGYGYLIMKLVGY